MCTLIFIEFYTHQSQGHLLNSWFSVCLPLELWRLQHEHPHARPPSEFFWGDNGPVSEGCGQAWGAHWWPRCCVLAYGHPGESLAACCHCSQQEKGTAQSMSVLSFFLDFKCISGLNNGFLFLYSSVELPFASGEISVPSVKASLNSSFRGVCNLVTSAVLP